MSFILKNCRNKSFTGLHQYLANFCSNYAKTSNGQDLKKGGSNRSIRLGKCVNYTAAIRDLQDEKCTYPLEIELGRHRGIPAENRLCKLCRREPETEEHFLLKCAKTNDIRQKMVSNIKGVLLQNGIVFHTLSLADEVKTLLSNVLFAKYVANFTILATEKKYKLLDK